MSQLVHFMIISHIFSCSSILINMYNVDPKITHRAYLLVKEYLYREIWEHFCQQCFGTSFLSQSARKYRFRYREKALNNSVSAV